jgi:predicted dinucleotide-binding enzyme
MVSFVEKILGRSRMFDTFAHIGMAYLEDTGNDLNDLLDVMGLSMAEKRNLVAELDDRFGKNIASGGTLLRAHTIDQAVEFLMELLLKRRPDLAEGLR